MIFNYLLGIENVDKEKVNINQRDAVRAIILNDNNILMVHTNKGDYKFPGGGVNKDETHEEALKREVREETGYLVNNVKELIGTFTQRKIDYYKKDTIFEMTSRYYFCEVSDDKTVQQLDAYESALDFQPVWITLDNAITLNEEILNNNNEGRNNWVYRETIVLRALKKSINKDNRIK